MILDSSLIIRNAPVLLLDETFQTATLLLSGGKSFQIRADIFQDINPAVRGRALRFDA